MDPLIPAAIGVSALALLFGWLALRSWIADRRAARDTIARRLR